MKKLLIAALFLPSVAWAQSSVPPGNGVVLYANPTWTTSSASGGNGSLFLAGDGTWKTVGGGGGGSGTVTSITAGLGLTGGTITTAGTISCQTFGSSLVGCVPASGGGSANFLRADGTWAVPPGTGGITIPSASLVNGNGSTLGSVALGTNLSLSGTFPNQTLNATGGGGGGGLTVGTTTITGASAGGMLYNNGGTLASTGTLLSGLPLVGGGSGTISTGTVSGNTTQFVTQGAGSKTSGHQLVYDGSGNAIDGGAPGSGGTVTSLSQGTGMSFSANPITATGTINLANTAVAAGSYTNTNLTVDAQGRITAASNGSGGTGTSVMSLGTFSGSVNAYTTTGTTPALSANTEGYRFCGTWPSSLAAPTAASTLAVGTAPALPFRVKSAKNGIIAFTGGEILPGTNGNPFCAQTMSSTWVLDGSAPGSLVDVGAGTTTVAQSDWAAQNVFTARTAGTTFTLPASAGISSQAGISVLVANPITAQLCATGSDTINGGSAAGCVTMGYGGIFAVSMPTPGQFFVPLSPDKKRPALSWAPGMNLSNVSIPIFHIDNNSTAVTATCRVEAAVGGAATVQLWAAPSGTACGSGTHIETTACNANGTALTSQTLGITNAAITGPADICAVFPTGAGWSSSSGAGSIQLNLTTP